MSAKSSRTCQASAADRIFVLDLVEKHGLEKAAAEIGISKLAALNLVSGRGSYSPTIRSVRAARARSVA